MKYIDNIIADIQKIGIETYNNDNEIDYVIDTRKLLEYLKPYEVEIPKEYNNDYNGIMSYLTNDVLNKGYKYYDWNINSGDAGLYNTKEEVYKMISEMGIDLLSKLNTDINFQKILSNITLPKGDA